jgi:RecJ-like exonuclease
MITLFPCGHKCTQFHVTFTPVKVSIVVSPGRSGSGYYLGPVRTEALVTEEEYHRHLLDESKVKNAKQANLEAACPVCKEHTTVSKLQYVETCSQCNATENIKKCSHTGYMYCTTCAVSLCSGCRRNHEKLSSKKGSE